MTGTVRNDSSGVVIEIFGPTARLEAFEARLATDAPPAAVVERISPEPIPGRSLSDFTIVASDSRRERRVSIPPDLATCDDCRRELFDPSDRRHRYPFTNCTNCGPRFTITLDVPYDRPLTTMASFVMCAACQQEYDDPDDRRFHAQPNACPACGPQVELWNAAGKVVAGATDAVSAAADAVRDGAIVAVKGLGGFHLMVDAGSANAVDRLRERKHRYEKPLALMVPGLEVARELCEVGESEERLLGSARAPIVLLKRRQGAPVAEGVAPDNPYLGLMLPYTPLHALLMAELRIPVVATSGNLSDEPICIDQSEAIERLAGIADLFLVHDRPIARHADDSVTSVIAGEPRMLRRARGWAPAPVTLERPLPPLLAVGAHLKNTVAVSTGDSVFISQHVGDMETAEASRAFEAVIADLLQMCRVEPTAIACDLHPDYFSTRWAHTAAAERGARLVAVQHHHAHLAASLAEAGLEGPALGVIWDGTGYGTDETVWGGEFLFGDAAGFRRLARLRPFRLPGGDAAVREPRRSALSLVWGLDRDEALTRELPSVRELSDDAWRLLTRMLATGFRAPVTTSAGRLFDGVAALAGLHQKVSFEGQAAMALEHIADPTAEGVYPLDVGRGEPSASEDDSELLELDWRPLVSSVVEDVRAGAGAGVISTRFHNALAGAILTVAERVGHPRVALSGGCFQNRLLTELVASALEAAGFEVLIHRRVPANDGGISLGQLAVAAARLEER